MSKVQKIAQSSHTGRQHGHGDVGGEQSNHADWYVFRLSILGLFLVYFILFLIDNKLFKIAQDCKHLSSPKTRLFKYKMTTILPYSICLQFYNLVYIT